MSRVIRRMPCTVRSRATTLLPGLGKTSGVTGVEQGDNRGANY
jgi:hypothetical protein